MSFTIGLRFYRVSVWKKGEKSALKIGPGCDPCDLFDFMNDFVESKKSTTIETEDSRTWFFEPKKTNAIRVIHGYINYGTHGFASKIKDVKTSAPKYNRTADDLEEIPLYFQTWAPEKEKGALIAFQSFQGRSCIHFVQSAMQTAFQTKYKDYSLVFKVLTAENGITKDAHVKAITLIRPQRSSDRFDKLAEKAMDEIEYEVTLKAKKRNGMLSRYEDIGDLLSVTSKGFVEFENQIFAGAKADIKVGSRRRTVGIFGSGLDAGLIDVSDRIETDVTTGHPTLKSIASEVDDIMQEMYPAIKS